MAPITLTYFDIEGVAEKVRLALLLAGADFEDRRVNRDTWQALKPTAPWGQLPLLEVNGKTWTQSFAMLRWAGRQNVKPSLAGLVPQGCLYPVDDVVLCLEIDEVMGLADDLARAWHPSIYVGMRPDLLGHEFGSDEEKVAKVKAIRERFLADDFPRMMGYFTKILESKGNKFLCGDSLTIADCVLLPQLRYFMKGLADFIPVTCLEAYPALTSWNERMMAIPEIQQWYSSKA